MTRWWLSLVTGVVGLVLGAAATLTVLGLGDDGTATWSCDGATVVASGAIADGRVVVQVTVRDPRSRSWEGEDPDGQTFPLGGGDATGALPTAALLTGDLDDGTTRRLAVRPVRSDEWCRGTVSAT